MQTNFKWWYAILGYAAYTLAFLFNTGFSMLSQGIFEGSSFNPGALFNVTMFIAGALICLLLFRMVSGAQISRYEYGFQLNGLAKIILIGVALGLFFYGLTYFIESNNTQLREASEQVAKEFKIGENFMNDLLILLNIGLFAPIAEEILFRGGIFNPLYQSLKTKTSIPYWAALGIALFVSTILFVYSHGGGGQDAQLWLLGLLGLLAALAMYWTKSIFAAILVHAVNNNIVFIFIVHKTVGLDSTHGMQLLIGSILCLILCVPLGLLFGRLLPGKSR